jgi:predicted glycoside hydrolase/deacetylase ChbG (UPF0249 family)
VATGIRLIINADDLGAAASINSAVDRLLEGGRITSSTILANGPAFDDVPPLTRRHEGASFGVHLNLSHFAPLTGPEGLEPLLGEDGSFHGSPRSLRYPPDLQERVRREWSAQVERVRDAGIRISHLDGHNFVHAHPSLLPALKAVQREYRIRAVRRPVSLAPGGGRPPLGARLRRGAWTLALRALPPRTKTTREMATFRDVVELLRKGALPDGATVEAMCHPGAEEGIPRLVELYRWEVELLESEWERELPLAVQRINYRQL